MLYTLLTGPEKGRREWERLKGYVLSHSNLTYNLFVMYSMIGYPFRGNICSAPVRHVYIAGVWSIGQVTVNYVVATRNVRSRSWRMMCDVFCCVHCSVTA